ncbi:DUF5995 family protein [Aridibaculum aurantiacum]|uniref:DUF5995 family protein n=1 Tax=Aridibaculum aurantiacum TaxID=2810307 RepID=UPI001A971418|nr:DUF5995 family protein [Aridibaculum aurantiacum]
MFTGVATQVFPPRAKTIADVIAQLEHIIHRSMVEKSRMGYFASIYLHMTEAVLEGIQKGVFANPSRMELLDVIFANRYIDAWHAYVHKQPCSNAWCAAYDACSNNDLIILQHVILGINTHINLDLAIAAAETAPGEKIYDLQQDFEKINDIIAGLTSHVQEMMCRLWFPLRMINKITSDREKAVINFSIKAARQAAWANAVALAVAGEQAKPNYIKLIDGSVVAIARKVINPGMYTNMLLRPVRLMEEKDVARVIKLLQEKSKKIALVNGKR